MKSQARCFCPRGFTWADGSVRNCEAGGGCVLQVLEALLQQDLARPLRVLVRLLRIRLDVDLVVVLRVVVGERMHLLAVFRVQRPTPPLEVTEAFHFTGLSSLRKHSAGVQEAGSHRDALVEVPVLPQQHRRLVRPAPLF